MKILYQRPMATDDPKMKMDYFSKEAKLKAKLLYSQRIPAILKNMSDIKRVQ